MTGLKYYNVEITIAFEEGYTNIEGGIEAWIKEGVKAQFGEVLYLSIEEEEEPL